MICGKTLKAKIQRLRWFGYAKKMNKERGPVKAQQLQLIGSKKRIGGGAGKRYKHQRINSAAMTG